MAGRRQKADGQSRHSRGDCVTRILRKRIRNEKPSRAPVGRGLNLQESNEKQNQEIPGTIPKRIALGKWGFYEYNTPNNSQK
jgi:hypothetical protein